VEAGSNLEGERGSGMHSNGVAGSGRGRCVWVVEPFLGIRCGMDYQAVYESRIGFFKTRVS
jgi:hypothetical protein